MNVTLPSERALRRTFLSTSLVALALALVACDPAPAPADGGSGADVPTVPVDAPPIMLTSLTYTPEGCAYEVVTPEALEAARGEDVFGATPTADHLHSSWAGPTDTTFAVNWRSDVDTLASSVIVGTDQAAVDAADGAAAGVTLVNGHHILYSSDARGRNPTRVHEVHLCGLTPGTTYYYRVGGPGHWSTSHAFSTGPAVGSTDPFSFGVSGDSRGLEDNAFSVIQRRLDDLAVDFEVFTGDAVVTGTVQSMWDDWFEGTDGATSVEDVLASIPIMMANGNHDDLAIGYLAQFALPQDPSLGEGASGEEWYSFDYGNAHFVVLNDTVMDDATLAGAEAQWLESDLSAVDRAVTPWIFVVHHKTLVTCESTHGAASIRTVWQPILDAHGVDLVLAGHNHVYERSLPVRAGDTVATADANGAPVYTAGLPSGTLYLVVGSAGAPYYPVATTCPTSRVGVADRRNYAVVEVDGLNLRLTVRDPLTDEVLDMLEYTR